MLAESMLRWSTEPDVDIESPGFRFTGLCSATTESVVSNNPTAAANDIFNQSTNRLQWCHSYAFPLRSMVLSVARFSSPAGMFSDGAAVLWRENLNEDANNKSATSFNALIYFKFLSLPWQFHSHFKATRWLRRFMIIMFIISCQHIAPGIVT